MEKTRQIIILLIFIFIIALIKPLSFTYAQEPSCTITSISPRLPGKDSIISVTFSVTTATELDLYFSKKPIQIFDTWVERVTGPVTKTVTLGKKDVGDYTVWLQRPTYLGGRNICSQSFGVAEKEGHEAVNEDKEARLANVCRSISNETVRDECVKCFELHDAWTALGCLDTQLPTGTSKGFITVLLRLGGGLAGGIAFLLILFGGFQIITSAGNPERLNAGRELITSAIAGLLLIIFSIFLLKVIGVDILGIPGFK